MNAKLILERATLEMRIKGECYRKVVEVEIPDTDNSEAKEKGLWHIVGYVEVAKMTKEELEKENVELKKELSENKVADCHIVNGLCEQLTNAKEIIREFLNYNSNSDWSVMSKKAEAFLKEVEK